MRLEERKEMHITLPKEVYDQLEKLSLERDIGMEQAVELLLKAALEIWEDEILVEMAKERMKEYNSQRTLSHEEIWD